MSDTDKAAMKYAKAEGRGRRKLAVGFALLVAGVFLAWRLGLFDLLTVENIDRLDTWFESLGWWAPLAFVVLWVVASVLFLPGLPITIAGGLVFGAVWGTVWTTVGANLGAVAAFLIGRYAARGMVEGVLEKNRALRKIDEGVKNQGCLWAHRHPTEDLCAGHFAVHGARDGRLQLCRRIGAHWGFYQDPVVPGDRRRVFCAAVVDPGVGAKAFFRRGAPSGRLRVSSLPKCNGPTVLWTS